MVEKELTKLKKKLNKLIESNASYDEIFKLSQEIDKLILLYYKEKSGIK